MVYVIGAGRAFSSSPFIANELTAIGLGDEQRLTQVLLNLVGNAIKFTDTGEVRVTAKTIDGHFNVSVSDTGSGIPAEHQTRIFEQFQQVDSTFCMRPSRFVSLGFSSKMMFTPERPSGASCTVRSWSLLDTRQYPNRLRISEHYAGNRAAVWLARPSPVAHWLQPR